MIKTLGVAVSCLLLTGTANSVMASNISQSHMKHVYEAWRTTPNKEGFISTAFKEAQIAKAYSTIMVTASSHEEILSHARRVRHALSGDGNGPGLGFGFIPAAQGTIQHISFAAQSIDTTQNIAQQANYIVEYTKNAISHAQQAEKLINAILATKSYESSLLLAKKLDDSINAIYTGSANKNTALFVKGTGLYKALEHLTIMRLNEGLLPNSNQAKWSRKK